jgi:hypothetical protein
VTAEQRAAMIIRSHNAIKEILDARYAAYHNLAEIKNLMANDLPNFNPNDLVLVHLGDSNGASSKARSHAGPFMVTRRESTITYLVKGADDVEVAIHAIKLCKYKLTNADLLGTNSLAASALGAAQSRMLGDIERQGQEHGRDFL